MTATEENSRPANAAVPWEETTQRTKRRGGLLRRMFRLRIVTLLLLMTGFAVWLAITFHRQPMTPENLHHAQVLTSIERDIWQVEWSPDRQRLALVGWEQPVEIREAITLFHIDTVGTDKKIIHFAFSSDPHVVAYCENDTTVVIVDARKSVPIRIDTGTAQPSMRFSPAGDLLATGGSSKQAQLWRVSDGELVQSLPSGEMGGLSVEFSPDGKTIAVGNRNSYARLFDVSSGKLLHTLDRPQTHGLAFDPSGTNLAIGYADGSIALWDVASGQQTHLQTGVGEEIYRVDWSPDGELLVSCGLNSDIVIWHGADLSEVHRLPADEWVIGARFSPDGSRLITAGGTRLPSPDREIKVWGVSLTRQLLDR